MKPKYHINNLPTEILFEVFDCLNFEQQKVATAVCQRWHTALSSEKYISRRSLCLTTCNLNGDSSLLQTMKRYRAFTIKDSDNKNSFLEPLRKFLFCQEVAEKVEQLRFNLFWYTFSDLLGDNNVRYLPKLKKIRYLSWNGIGERNEMRCKLVAPYLKTVILEDAKNFINPLIRTMNEQIETFSVRIINKTQFCATLGNLPFTKLTSLILTTYQGALRFWEADFNESHLQIFGRLNYLEISDTGNVFYSIYRLIFREAKKLETLVIDGYKMSEDAFNQLDQLKKLKKLYLVIEIDELQSPVKLSLPLLEEMTTYARGIAPLVKAPNLKSLTVVNYRKTGYLVLRYKFPWSPYRLTEGAIKYDILTPYLLTVTLHGVCLKSRFVDKICTRTGLRALELKRVRMESKHLQKISSTLKHLQCVRLECCYIRDNIKTNKGCSTPMDVEDDETDDDQDEDGNVEDNDKPDCVQMLQEQFPGLRITEWHNWILPET